jgi:hypothetical protein
VQQRSMWLYMWIVPHLHSQLEAMSGFGAMAASVLVLTVGHVACPWCRPACGPHVCQYNMMRMAANAIMPCSGFPVARLSMTLLMISHA